LVIGNLLIITNNTIYTYCLDNYKSELEYCQLLNNSKEEDNTELESIF